jgi:DGQHR domain-containing protein
MNAPALPPAQIRHLPVSVGPELKSKTLIVSGFMAAGLLIPDNYKIPYRDSLKKTGYQRPPQQTRINELASDLKQGHTDLPTAVLLNFRDHSIRNALKYGDRGAYLDLTVVWAADRPRRAGAYFFVVDGQHRILSLQKVIEDEARKEGGQQWLSFQIPFVCMLGADENEEMDQFYIVNSKAKSVRTDLAYELLKDRADRDGTVYQALLERGREWQVDAQGIVQRLFEASPVWRHAIRLPSMEKGSTTISNTGMVTSMKPLLNDSPLFKRASMEHRIKILDAYWKGIKASLPEAFEDPTEYSLQKGHGAIILHEVLPDVLELVRSKGLSVTESDSYESVLGPALQNLEGDNGRGETVKGVNFWRATIDGAAGSFSSSVGRRVLSAKLRQLLPRLDVE